MTRSSDAVITICGRIGTLNEFTTAFEDKRVMGVLTGTGGIEEDIDHILKLAKRGRKRLVFDSDPKRLVERIIKAIRVNDRQKHSRQKETA
jgi:hypothetical protein